VIITDEGFAFRPLGKGKGKGIYNINLYSPKKMAAHKNTAAKA